MPSLSTEPCTGTRKLIISCSATEDCENSKVNIVDLKQVQFPSEFNSWQYHVNQGGADSLLRDIRDTRDQVANHPSPFSF